MSDDHIVKLEVEWEEEESPLVHHKDDEGRDTVTKEVAVTQVVTVDQSVKEEVKQTVTLKEEVTVKQEVQVKEEVDDTFSDDHIMELGVEGKENEDEESPFVQDKNHEGQDTITKEVAVTSKKVTVEQEVEVKQEVGQTPSGLKRQSDDDGFSSDDDIPLKKLCPASPTSSPSRALANAAPVHPAPAANISIISTPTHTVVPLPPAHIIISAPKNVEETTHVSIKPLPPASNSIPTEPDSEAPHMCSDPADETAASDVCHFSITDVVDTLQIRDHFSNLQQFIELSMADMEGRLQRSLHDATSNLNNRLEKVENAIGRLTNAVCKIVQSRLQIRVVESQKTQSPAVTDIGNGLVMIGDQSNTVQMSRRDIQSFFSRSLCGKDYVLKLMLVLFSSQELFGTNFSGGRTICGSEIVHKQGLCDNLKFKALMAQTEKDFPGSTTGVHFKVIKDAVNGKCRKQKL